MAAGSAVCLARSVGLTVSSLGWEPQHGVVLTARQSSPRSCVRTVSLHRWENKEGICLTNRRGRWPRTGKPREPPVRAVSNLLCPGVFPHMHVYTCLLKEQSDRRGKYRVKRMLVVGYQEWILNTTLTHRWTFVGENMAESSLCPWCW